MEEIKAPKKERKFLKGLGEIALVLIRELVLGIGKKVINRVGKKREGLVIAFFVLTSYFAFAQYPATGNKQRLGYQTTADGLVWRGRANDTVSLKPSTINNSYIVLDTVNNVMYVYIKSIGGWKFNNSDTVIIQGATMPFDSITFNTAKDGTVGVGEVEYNDTQGSLIQGLKGGNVTNIIGQQLHQRVSNVTGSTLSKGTAVYLSGSQGNRITVAKALATSDPTSANTFGIVAESIADNASGYVITEGLITGINTSGLTEDSAVYLSPTVAGGLTSTKPQAPNHGVYIGVCVKTNAGSGELFVKIKNGLELDELHDVLITSPASNASLYYKSSEGIWRDTTAALLVSDTASMLTPYFRDADTTSLNLVSRFATKLNISDTSAMLTNYLRSGVAASTYQTKLNGTGFVKATGTTITYDNSTYLTTSSASSTYLPLTGGTLTGTLNGTKLNLNSGIDVSGDFSTSYHTNVSGLFRGYQVLIAPNNDYGQTRIHFPNRPVTESFSNFGSGIRHKWGGSDARNSFLSLYTSSSSNLQIDAISIDAFGNVGINDTTPSYTLDVNGTLGVTGAATLSSTLAVTGATTLSNLAGSGTRMVTATSTGLLGTQNILTPTTRGSNTFTLPDIGAISFLRYNADNTVSQRAADGMRSDLGGTTIGQNMFILTNPSAITFPRFNADNTVSALSATDFRTAIGAGTGNGNGTVTSVTGSLPISSSGGTTPNITIANASTTASGVVTTSTQSMAGNKTFTGDLATSGAFSATGFSTLTGGASVGTMATTSTLTHILGVNSSNAIGEVALGNLSLSSGILNVNVSDGIKTSSGAVALDMFRTITVGTDFPNTSAQSSSDITVTVTGAVAGQPVWLGVPNSAVSANTSYSAWVSAANTVTIRFNNYSSGSVNPSSGSFYVVVINL